MKRLGIGEQCANDLLDRTTGGSRTRAQKTDDSNAHERSLATFRRKYAFSATAAIEGRRLGRARTVALSRSRPIGPASQMLALTFCPPVSTLTRMQSKDPLTSELAALAHVMVHGSLSEVTRQCGDPSCACATDPARRHGPHLYLKFTADGKSYSIYVPPEEQ